MTPNELITDNNSKRRLLTKENRKYYEDMLIYIRLSLSKPEQETEEILSELLDHLLQAQEDGKTAEDVFSNNPKQYANEIIGELPKIVTRERIQLFVMALLYLLASYVLFTVISNLVLYYIFHTGDLSETYFIGTTFIKLLTFVPISFCLFFLVVYYIRWSCFKHINKILEFFLFWIYGILSLGIFMLVIFLIPDFGPYVSIPLYAQLTIGLVLLVLARFFRAYK